MSATQQAASTRTKLSRMLILCAALLFVFVVYAPSVRLMLFYDDSVIIPAIAGRNLFSIFANNGAVDVNYRPLSYALWLLVRDLFGWFIPALVHMWNVWLHTLNMAMLAALATYFSRLHALDDTLMPALCIVIFGLFPLSYEAVLWAAAVNHLLMTAFGLLAILVYVNARGTVRWRARYLLASGGLLLAACLSHEMGFVYGVLLLLVECARRLRSRRWPRISAVVLCGLALVYPVCYQVFIRTSWAKGDSLNGSSFASGAGAWLPNAAIHAQGLAGWLIVLVREAIGLPESRIPLVLFATAISVGLAMAALWRAHLLQLGTLALTWWLVAIVPSTLLLSGAYVSSSPRLLYEPSVAIALFWATVIIGLWRLFHWPYARFALLGVTLILLAWCIPFIGGRRDEFARLTPVLRQIDADLRSSSPSAHVLLINMPWWTTPANPDFLLGSEGIQIFQHGGAPVWTWLASTSGVRRETVAVRHDISLRPGVDFQFGIYGNTVDDTGLRAALLESNYVYRFDYDPPGLRVERLAVIGNDQTNVRPLAKLANGNMEVAIRDARATTCGNNVVVDLAWSDARRFSQPVGVFVHVYDMQDRQAIIADKDLMDGYLPLDRVPTGVPITETRQIAIPATVAPLKEVHVGAYLRSNGKRLTAVRADGDPWEGDSVVVPISEDRRDLCQLASDWPTGANIMPAIRPIP